MKNSRFSLHRVFLLCVVGLLSAGSLLYGNTANVPRALAQKSATPWLALDMDTVYPEYLLVKYQGPARTNAVDQGQILLSQTHQALGATVTHQYRHIPWQVVRIPTNMSMLAAAAHYARDPHVTFVEPNHKQQLLDTVPDDANYDKLWGMERINAPQAWDIGTDSADIVVAVIDTGIRTTHEDLKDNLWVNPSPGPMNDIHGAAFTGGGGGMTSGDPNDNNGHGTHVSGTIGATGNNATGVVGVTWNVQIMALKFLDPYGSTADAISALEYAIDNGAHLSNNSWGGGGFSQALEDKIAAAGAANQLFVAAAGNDGWDADTYPMYPAAYTNDNIISVASIAEGGALSGFSNYGEESVDIAAPGSAIHSAWNTADDAYHTISGTSMASPHVAGAVALLLGTGGANIPYDDLRDLIFKTATLNPALAGRCVTEGELNLFDAIKEVGSSLQLDRRAYRPAGTAGITLLSPSIPLDTNTVDVVWSITRDALPVSTGIVSVIRIAPTAIAFAGSLPLTGTGALHGDQLRVSYTDVQSNVLSSAAMIDAVPPVITNARIDAITESSFRVNWGTDEPVRSVVYVDTALPPLASAFTNELYQTNHATTAIGLESLTRYFARIAVEDYAGNPAALPIPAQQSDEQTYFDKELVVLTRATAVTYETHFERGPEGWTAETLFGESMWEYGEPRYGPDPGSRSWGTVIDGNYPSSSAGVLTSPVLYAGKRPQIELDYWAYIGIVSDRLVIEARTDDTPWKLVGSMWTGQTLGWQTATFDLGPAFAHQPVRVRARFESDKYAYRDYDTVGNPPGVYLDAVRLTELKDKGLVLAGLQLDDSAEGDGDGYPEAGETVTIQPLVANFSDDPLIGLTGTVSVVAAGLDDQALFFPDGAPPPLDFVDVLSLERGVAAAPFRLHLPATLPPTTKLMLVMQLQDANAKIVELTADIGIAPRVSISGSVEDAGGSPLAGELVEAKRGAFEVSDQSAADGSYGLQGLFPGARYRVSVGDQMRMLTVASVDMTNINFVLGAAPEGFQATQTPDPFDALEGGGFPATVPAPAAADEPPTPVEPFAVNAVSGMVTVVNWSLDMQTSVTNPLPGAKVLVENTAGVTVDAATSDSNGVYRLATVPDGPHWFHVQAPSSTPPQPWYVAPSGRTIVVTNSLPPQPFVFQDYGFKAPYLLAEAPLVLDADGDQQLERGELVTVQFPLYNAGAAVALSVTGHVETAAMGIPAVMDVTQGLATNRISIYPDGPTRMLSPAFTLQVHTNAPKGSLQRFTVHVAGTNSTAGTKLTWPFNFTLQTSTKIEVRATVTFADNPEAAQLAQNLFATRIRLTVGDSVRELRPDANGEVVFQGGAVQLGASGSIEISQLPPGYAVPPALAIAPLTDNHAVAFTLDPWAVEVDPATLHFPIREGQATNGSFTVHNRTSSTQELEVAVMYRRTVDEVIRRTAETPLATAAASEERVQATAVEPETQADYETTEEVVVRFVDGLSRAEQEQLLASAGLEAVFFFNSSPAALARPVAAVEGEAALAVTAATTTLEDDKRILTVTPDTVAKSYALPEPNDEFYHLLYGLHNERQTGGTTGMDIRAPQAWTESTGSKRVVAAVVDTGILTYHPDLAANIWHNPSPGTSEGISGDIHGWNFYDWNANVDDNSYFGGHGTHVAGTIGAVGNNAVGVVGVNWEVDLMALRLVSLYSQFTTSARIAKAIEYAAENGAQVSNHSWGGPDTAGVMYDAIVYAAEHNHLVIAAAGNSSLDLDVMRAYPAGYGGVLDNVITVAASDHHGELAYFSNFGANRVQLAAPGYNIASTYAFFGIPWYAYLSGTSMAAPHVTGVAALLWSLDPDAPYTVIRDAILEGVRPDPRLKGWVQTGGHLDAERAMRALGKKWLKVDQTSITLAPGAEQDIQVTVNDPAALPARAADYRADIQITQINGQSLVLVPVTTTVEPDVWLDLGGLRFENLASWPDGLDAAPGDTVDIWVEVQNRGDKIAQDLTGTLRGGGASTLITNSIAWGYLYGSRTEESLSPFRVKLDPAATNDISFTLDLYEKGTLVATLPVVVPVLSGYHIKGRVVADGAGVAATVETVGAHGARTATAPDGSFVLRGLSDGAYDIRILPEAYARTNRTAIVAEAHVDLGDIIATRPTGVPAASALAATGLLGGEQSVTLTIHNNEGDSPFAFTLRALPKRRIALISDGTSLAALVEPLTQMGFVVEQYQDNFAREHVFYEGYRPPFYEIQQTVRWTDDAALLSRYDAVIADTSGPDGEGRLFQSGEVSAFSNFVQRGGTAILTGANPLSIPDNHELAELVGVDSLDRAATASSGQVASQLVFDSPFLTLSSSGQFVLGSLQPYDLAAVQTNLSLALFETDLANKLVTRRQGAGQLYLWTGNGAAKDWETPGVWLDLLRGMLWNVLYEQADAEVDWLQLAPVMAGAETSALSALTTARTLHGEVPAGGETQVAVSMDAGYPLRTGDQEAVLVILGQAGGTDVRAVDLDFAVVPPVLRVFTSGKVDDWRGNLLQGDGGADAARYQVIATDGPGTVLPPNPDGRPGVGNRLLATDAAGLLYGRFGAGLEVPANAGQFDQDFRLPEDQAAGYVFVRAWDSPTFQDSIAYGDSPLFPITYAAGAGQDFGSWSVTNALHPGRDSNNDSVADGWIIENALHLDPRDPVAALVGAGTADGTIPVPNGRLLADPRRVAVAGDLLFVLDPPNHRLLSMDRESGAVLHALGLADGTSGTALGAFTWPYGLALDPRPGVHRLIVADTGNDRLQVITFDPESGALTPASVIGASGSGPGQFSGPRGVTVMPGSGDLFVADTKNNRIQAFRANGTYLFGISGSANFLMQEPHAVAVDPDDGIYVADTGNARILQYTFAGTGVRAIGPNAADGEALFSRPTDIQVWRQDIMAGPQAGEQVQRLVVADEHYNRIQLLSMTGEPLLQVGQHGSQIGELRLPYGVFPMPNDDVLYVADRGNGRIQSFSIVLDTDADGMHDLWEDRMGLDSSRDDAFEDADGDGLMNVGEYIVGTSPWDDTDNPFAGMEIGTTGAFTILGFQKVEEPDGAIATAASGKSLRLLWQARTGRRYRVEWVEALGADWQTVATYEALGSVGSVEIPAVQAVGFFRIVVDE